MFNFKQPFYFYANVAEVLPDEDDEEAPEDAVLVNNEGELVVFAVLLDAHASEPNVCIGRIPEG